MKTFSMLTLIFVVTIGLMVDVDAGGNQDFEEGKLEEITSCRMLIICVDDVQIRVLIST